MIINEILSAGGVENGQLDTSLLDDCKLENSR